MVTASSLLTRKPADLQGDVFIPARFVGDAMQGDSVLVSVEKVKDDGRAEGRILKVLERRNRHHRWSIQAG